VSDKNKTRITTAFWIILAAVIFIGVKFCGKISSGSNFSKSSTDKYVNGKYELVFSDKFNKSLASEDDLGLSIFIAIDCSGSMDDLPKSGDEVKRKYQIASESLTEIISFLYNFYKNTSQKENLKLKVGLAKFSSTVDILFDLSELNEANFEKLKSITSDKNNFQPSGNTAIGETLKVCSEQLEQSGTIFKSLIVITDGENTTGVSPDTVLDAIVNNRNNKSTKDFPVLTSNILVSFIGFDVNAETFSTMHQNGARIMSASNKIELNESLKNLFLADITKLESK
jgi:von Willebrand factor type A domain